MAFQLGKEALESILALAGPIHRVKEIHARATDLSGGVEAIEQVGGFRDKWGTAFVALRAFTGQLRAVEHLLPSDGRGKGFLGEYEVAEAGARFAEPEVWKTLQAAKASAELELQDLLNSWRKEARRIAEEALSRLPGDLELRGLEAALCKPLTARPAWKWYLRRWPQDWQRIGQNPREQHRRGSYRTGARRPRSVSP
jgi:hypothetical protein